MKLGHYWAFLKLEGVAFRRAAPAIFPALGPGVFLVTGMDRLDDGVFAGMIATSVALSGFISYAQFFQGENNFFKRPGHLQVTRLEFSFSLAVERRALYYAKATWFALAAVIPFLAFLIYSLFRPDRIISDLGRNLSAEATRSFYLGHFPGAIIQGAKGSLSIFLPRGHVDFAWGLLLCALVVSAIYQGMLLAFLRVRWSQWVLPVLFILLPLASLFWSAVSLDRANQLGLGRKSRIPVLDQGLAWGVQHWVLALVIGLLVIGCALRLGCRRFVRQEVLT